MSKAIAFCILTTLILIGGIVFHSRFDIRVVERGKKYETRIHGIKYKHVVVGPGIVLGEESIEDAKHWCEIMQTQLVSPKPDPSNYEFFQQEFDYLNKLQIRSSLEEEGINYKQVMVYANAWRRLLQLPIV